MGGEIDERCGVGREFLFDFQRREDYAARAVLGVGSVEEQLDGRSGGKGDAGGCETSGIDVYADGVGGDGLGEWGGFGAGYVDGVGEGQDLGIFLDLEPDFVLAGAAEAGYRFDLVGTDGGGVVDVDPGVGRRCGEGFLGVGVDEIFAVSTHHDDVRPGAEVAVEALELGQVEMEGEVAAGGYGTVYRQSWGDGGIGRGGMGWAGHIDGEAGDGLGAAGGGEIGVEPVVAALGEGVFEAKAVRSDELRVDVIEERLVAGNYKQMDGFFVDLLQRWCFEDPGDGLAGGRMCGAGLEREALLGIDFGEGGEIGRVGAGVGAAYQVGERQFAARVGGDEVGIGALRVFGGDGETAVVAIEVAGAGDAFVVFGEGSEGEHGADGRAFLGGRKIEAAGEGAAVGDFSELVAGTLARAVLAVGAVDGVAVESVADDGRVLGVAGQELLEKRGSGDGMGDLCRAAGGG